MNTDSVQYLSVAQNFREGLFGFTSLVNYDAERSFGTVPAPMVTFPLGYPASIAVVSMAVPDPALAAFSISAAATIGTIVVLWTSGGMIGLSRLATNVLLAIVALNQTTLTFAGSTMAEALFTFVAFSGVALLLLARKLDGGERPFAWILAGSMFGLSYHVRYAGLFFVIGLLILAVLRSITHGRQVFQRWALAAATAVLVILPGMLRNIWLVGSWRGGNEKPMFNSLVEVMIETARALNGILFGLECCGPFTFIVLRLLFVALATWLVVWTIRSLLADRASQSTSASGRDNVMDLAVLTLAYAALMFYAGMTSVIHYGARMLVPLIPIVALLVVWLSVQALNRESKVGWRRRVPAIAIAACLLVYISTNLTTLAFYEPVSVVPKMERVVESRDKDGRTARSIALAYVGADGVLVANEGQVLGHVLGTRTVSLVDPHWSATAWTEQAIRLILQKYHAAALLIVKPRDERESADLTTFLTQLSAGSTPPWMRRVFSSNAISIYIPAAPGWSAEGGLQVRPGANGDQ